MKAIYDRIYGQYSKLKESKAFWIDGPGGTGKTFVFNVNKNNILINNSKNILNILKI